MSEVKKVSTSLVKKCTHVDFFAKKEKIDVIFAGNKRTASEND